MNRKKLFKIVIFLLITGIIFQGFVITYSLMNSPKPDGIVISEEILNSIKLSDPNNYDTNISNYKALLVKLFVHNKFKVEIERLIAAKHKLPDILTAYSFLNDNYGFMQDIQKLVLLKESGKSWPLIFKEYKKTNPEYEPGNFDSNYLESISKTPGITTDDIMIGDRVSQKAAKPFKDIIAKRFQGTAWKDINADLNIVNGQAVMPHMKITREQVAKYVTSGGLTEQQIVAAFVIADKMEASVEVVISKEKAGLSKEDIYAYCFENKFY